MSAYDELRKAVEAALQNLESSGVDERTYNCLNEHFASDGDCPLVKLHKQLKSALAEPVRNCDVGTAEEWYARFESFCAKHFRYANDDPCAKCPLKDDLLPCVCRFLQMPYEEGGTK